MRVTRAVAVPNRAVAAAACALATHALVYGTLWPSGTAHAYFGWYEPLVASLSLASFAGLLGLVAVASVARRRGRPLARPLHARRVTSTRWLAGAAFAIVVAQETVERSVLDGGLAFPSFSPSQWLLVLAGVVSTALVVALIFRAGRAVVERLTVAAHSRRPLLLPGWAVVTAARRRPRPQAGAVGLRGPPPLRA